MFFKNNFMGVGSFGLVFLLSYQLWASDFDFFFTCDEEAFVNVDEQWKVVSEVCQTNVKSVTLKFYEHIKEDEMEKLFSRFPNACYLTIRNMRFRFEYLHPENFTPTKLNLGFLRNYPSIKHLTLRGFYSYDIGWDELEENLVHINFLKLKRFGSLTIPSTVFQLPLKGLYFSDLKNSIAIPEPPQKSPLEILSIRSCPSLSWVLNKKHENNTCLEPNKMHTHFYPSSSSPFQCFSNIKTLDLSNNYGSPYFDFKSIFKDCELKKLENLIYKGADT